MLKRLVNALRGSARLEVAGPFPERFLNLCAQGGIQFWGVAWLEPTRLRLTVARRDGGRATALGERAGCAVTPAGEAAFPQLPKTPPYEGAKDYIWVEDVDDRETMTALTRLTCLELQVQPKKRRK